MFNTLGENLNKIFDKLRGKGFISEQDIAQTLREIRIILLESDVALSVVKDLIDKIKIKAVGAEIIKSVSPGQMVVKIVHDEIVNILTGQNQSINLAVQPPAVILIVGLQGCGKTTTAAKLALRLRQKNKKKILLASLDIYRPAAQKQLEILGKQISVDTLEILEKQSAAEITKRAMQSAKKLGHDVLILDTAGRLHIDEELMAELTIIEQIANPVETLLILDSMTGQDTVKIALQFKRQLKLTGAILTKTDGDAKGGAALSLCAVTGCPIKFIGTGEKLNELEEFHPNRAVSRILGMGDIISLVEKASENIDSAEATRMADRLQKGIFSMDDLLAQLKTLRKIGNIGSFIGMIPGLNKIKGQLPNIDNKTFTRHEAIINSMTHKERKDPRILNASRKHRIAKGSGTQVQDINRLVKQYLEMQSFVKKFGSPDGKMLDKIGKILNGR